jgi:ACT domain-containing protein
MRTIVTVISADRVGIIAEVCSLFASMNVNILDLSQTTMQGVFTMTMLVDTTTSEMSFEQIKCALTQKGNEAGLSIRIQREDIFNAMHRI